MTEGERGPSDRDADADADANADADADSNADADADANANANADSNANADAEADAEANANANAESAAPRGAPRDPNARDDELLADPPETDFHLGRLGGYRAAGRMRSILALGFGIATIAAIAAGYYYITYLQEHRTPVHAVPLPAGSDIEGRPRTMTWSGGKARLGLTREPPGLLEIELPDRTIRLADGCDSAQVRVNVDGGRTVEVTVLFGDVVQEATGE